MNEFVTRPRLSLRQFPTGGFLTGGAAGDGIGLTQVPARVREMAHSFHSISAGECAGRIGGALERARDSKRRRRDGIRGRSVAADLARGACRSRAEAVARRQRVRRHFTDKPLFVHNACLRAGDGWPAHLDGSRFAAKWHEETW